MATELAKAYVQIIPSAEGIKGKIQETIDPEAGSAGTSFGSKMIGTIKNVIAAARSERQSRRQSAKERTWNRALAVSKHYLKSLRIRLRRMPPTLIKLLG